MCHNVKLQWTLEFNCSTLRWTLCKILTPIKFIISTNLELIFNSHQICWIHQVFIKKVTRKGRRLNELKIVLCFCRFFSHYRVSIKVQGSVNTNLHVVQYICKCASLELEQIPIINHLTDSVHVSTFHETCPFKSVQYFSHWLHILIEKWRSIPGAICKHFSWNLFFKKWTKISNRMWRNNSFYFMMFMYIFWS